MHNEYIYILFDKDWFKKGDIITGVVGEKFLIVRTPKRKWYHILLETITFRWFKASHTYRVIQINK